MQLYLNIINRNINILQMVQASYYQGLEPAKSDLIWSFLVAVDIAALIKFLNEAIWINWNITWISGNIKLTNINIHENGNGYQSWMVRTLIIGWWLFWLEGKLQYQYHQNWYKSKNEYLHHQINFDTMNENVNNEWCEPSLLANGFFWLKGKCKCKWLHIA